MKNILLIDNFDSFTFNLVDFFETAGANVDIVRNDISVEKITACPPPEKGELEGVSGDTNPPSPPSQGGIYPLKKYDLLVISPGPSVPKNAGNLMKIIEKSVGEIPIFGVCLGHEALAEYFGGSLKFVEPVHGKSSPIHHDGKGAFTDLPQDFPGGRYHSLAIDEFPKDFVATAKTADGTNMGMRHKTLPIESVQFHPESVLTMKNENGRKMVENVLEFLAR